MRDLPDGPSLLALAAAALERQIADLPGIRRAELGLVLRCIEVALSETRGDAGPPQLAELYAVPECHPDLLVRRFCHDLRAGAFDGVPVRAEAARAMLWRLTLSKLRRSNPKFLTMNGFADPCDRGE